MLNENILITEQDLEFAQSLSSNIENNDLRFRATANILACRLCGKYFEDVEIDNKTSICHSLKIQEQLDISDVYLNNQYLDVRFYFNENEMFIPASHKEFAIEPVAYMFVKLNNDITGGIVTGFITSQSIDESNLVENYYKISESDLVSYYDIEPLLVTPEEVTLSDNFVTDIYDFLDGRLVDKSSFLKLLLSSQEAREKYLDIVNAQFVIKSLSLKDDLKEDFNENNSADSLELSLENDFLDLDAPSDLNQDIDILDNILENDFADSSQDDNLIEAVDEPFIINDDDNLLVLNDDFLVKTSDNDYIELSDDISNNLDIDDSFELEEDLRINDEVELLEQTVSLESFDENFSTEITPSIREFEDEVREEETTLILPENTEEIVENISLDDLQTEDSDFNDVISITFEDESSANEEVIENQEIILGKEEQEEQEVSNSIESDALVESNEIQNDIISDFLIEENEESEEVEVKENINKEKHIDKLFNKAPYEDSDQEILMENNQTDEEFIAEEESLATKPKQSSLLPLIGVITIICASGYFAYNKFVNQSPKPAPKVEKKVVPKVPAKSQEPLIPVTEKEIEEAMPIETIENKNVPPTEEPIPVSIPAIEKNLDASILVSNLSVGWEIPQSYLKDASVKKYFTKLGKIIQLHLKTELLLLNKPPLTNRITVELHFNKTSSCFDVVGVVDSSGEKVVDTLIMQTIKNVLSGFKIDENFEEKEGNPILVINL